MESAVLLGVLLVVIIIFLVAAFQENKKLRSNNTLLRLDLEKSNKTITFLNGEVAAYRDRLEESETSISNQEVLLLEENAKLKAKLGLLKKIPSKQKLARLKAEEKAKKASVRKKR